jgi:protein tyrosine phosphatase (PTP) superfamily phosphohydrolase (DUF442 family)
MDWETLQENTRDPFVGYYVNKDGRSASMDHVQLLSHIIDNLYVGGHSEYADLEDFFTHVFSLYAFRPKYKTDEGVVHESVRMYDSPDEDPTLVNALVDKVVAALNTEGSRVLVHCQAGINRSNLVAALVLRKWKGLTSAEAIAMLREKRSPLVLANPGFEAYLLSLD